MNIRNRQRLKALDMRIRSKSNGLANLKIACELGQWILDSYRKNLILNFIDGSFNIYDVEVHVNTSSAYNPYLPFIIQNREC